MSILFRTILALNCFVLGLAGALGWIAQDTAGQVVEERFATEMATGVSHFFRTKEYPLNNTMMTYLREMFHCEWVACRQKVSQVAASSLSPDATRQFADRIARMDNPGLIELGGRKYRLAWADLPVPNPPADTSSAYRLFMLVPNEQFVEARSRASSQVLMTMLPSAVIATVLAILLAFTITRPLRRLAGEMDRLARDDGAETAPADGDAKGDARVAPPEKGPIEIARVSASFHQLLSRLEAARNRLARSERLATLGKVSLSVAHELRNPLSGIKMHARLLKDEAQGAAAESLEVMLREIDRMELYLDELMSLTIDEQARTRPLVVAPVRLSEIAEGVLAILAGRCRHAKIEARREFPADEPAVQADGAKLRQVVMNLMVNAIQAMPTGGTMTVRVLVQDSAVRLEVRDTGKGVAIADRDIFEAFVSDKPNGVGLGLFLCRQIISRHGGNIGYDTSAAGAAFWFILPKGESK